MLFNKEEMIGETTRVPYGPDRQVNLEGYQDWLMDVWELLICAGRLDLSHMQQHGAQVSHEYLQQEFTRQQKLVVERWAKHDT